MNDIEGLRHELEYAEAPRAAAFMDSTSASVELHLLVRAACSRHRLMAKRIGVHMHVLLHLLFGI